MIKEIQDVFISNLEQLSWMDTQTKEAAKEKVLIIKHVNKISRILFDLHIMDDNICIFPPFAFLRPKLSGNELAILTKFWMTNTSTMSTLMYEHFSFSTLWTGSTEATHRFIKRYFLNQLCLLSSNCGSPCLSGCVLSLAKLQRRQVLWEHFAQLWTLAKEAPTEAPSESQQRDVSWITA